MKHAIPFLVVLTVAATFFLVLSSAQVAARDFDHIGNFNFRVEIENPHHAAELKFVLPDGTKISMKSLMEASGDSDKNGFWLPDGTKITMKDSINGPTDTEDQSFVLPDGTKITMKDTADKTPDTRISFVLPDGTKVV